MSSIVVDTHIVIWDQLDPKRLSAKASKAVNEADKTQIILSEISLWEISILMKKKRLVMEISYLEFMDYVLQARNYVLQGINPEIAYLAGEIEVETKDPADRIIAATALYLGYPLVTSDRYLHHQEGIKIIW